MEYLAGSEHTTWELLGAAVPTALMMVAPMVVMVVMVAMVAAGAAVAVLIPERPYPWAALPLSCGVRGIGCEAQNGPPTRNMPIEVQSVCPEVQPSPLQNSSSPRSHHAM
tara:strand:+ start:122 stop:451 length:330 start_codon:yes stop_codon:yes gene_type:complete